MSEKYFKTKSVSLSVQRLEPFQNRQKLAKISQNPEFAYKNDDIKTALTFEGRKIETWFLHIFHLEFNFQQFRKNKISKIFDPKNFEIFLGSFLENLLMGSSDDPTQKTIHCVHLPMADPKIPDFGMIHDITN